jgi:hypothetical protein
MTDESTSDRAKRSAHISIIFEAAVKRVFAAYAVEMTRPEGGARALLHIRLVTEGSTYALGWANPADGTAELYTLGHTLALSKRRRGRELTLPPLSYARFLETAQRVLEDFGIVVTIVAYTKDDDAEPDSVSPTTSDAPEADEPRRTPTLPYLGMRGD